MFYSHTIALFLVILCSIQLQYGNAAIQGSRGSQHLIFVDKKAFNEGNLIFAVCDKNTPSVTRCTIVQKVYPNTDNNHLCNVTLEGDDEKSVLGITVGVSTLGKDKAILFWEDVLNNSSTTKIGTVNLETCKMNVVKIPDPNREIIMDLYMSDNLVTYEDDSYDIYINDPARFGKNLGKMEINANGTAKGEPVASNIKRYGMIHYLSTIATRSSSKGYAYLRKDELEFTLFLVKPDGSEKELAKYPNGTAPVVAAGDNVLSVCSKAGVESKVSCTQYDENGDAKFTKIVHVSDQNTGTKAVHNLPGGGMLVMLVESKCDVPSECKSDVKHHLAKIASDGKVVGVKRFKDFDGVDSQWKKTYVYKHGDSEYCAAMIENNPSTEEHEIFHHCITESELSDVQLFSEIQM